MSNVQKAINTNDIRNGLSIINSGGINFNLYDSSINTNESLDTINNLLNFRFDDTTYYGSFDQNGGIVAIAYGSDSVVTSIDGSEFLTESLPSSSTWISVTKGDDRYIAVAAYTNKIASRYIDSTEWNESLLELSAGWIQIIYSAENNMYTIIPNTGSSYLTSSDGISWSSKTLPTSANWQSIAYTTSLKYVLIINSSSSYATSNDGLTWTIRSFSKIYNSKKITAIYGSGVNDQYFITVSNSDKILNSTDAINWIELSLTQSSLWQNIAYGNDTYVVIANGSSTINVSTDKITWTAKLIINSQWQKIIYKNSLFYIIGYGSTFLTSENGSTWTQRFIPANNWIDIA